MFRVKDKGLFRILITVFTALTVMISVCLGDEDPHQFTGSGIRGPDGIVGWVDSGIPSPEEEPALFIKNGTARFNPLRTEFQRIFISCRTHGRVSASYQPSLRAGSTISYILDVKNSILLKLRI
jgi:hypothetical protein